MDPYLILGIPRGSSRRRVKEAFRTLVHIAHPDRGGDPEAFVRLCVAYRDILDELEPDDGPDAGGAVIAPAAASGVAVRPGPGAPDAAYLDWLGQIAAEVSRRRRRRPWWRKHPERARAWLLGLIGLCGALALAAAVALALRPEPHRSHPGRPAASRRSGPSSLPSPAPAVVLPRRPRTPAARPRPRRTR